jgi:nitrogen fixation/metabolism regulation signal transduction histidine kinase
MPNRKQRWRIFVIGLYIPPDLSENMASISKGIDEYQQIKLLKKPIQITYYITLSIVALLVIFCAVWFGLYLAKTITIPIIDLAEGSRRIAEGDLTVSVDSNVTDDEIGSLVNAFNKMTKELRSNRQELELSARKLTQQNQEIEARRQYMEIVLKNVSAGVITLDAKASLRRSINRRNRCSPSKRNRCWINTIRIFWLPNIFRITEDFVGKNFLGPRSNGGVPSSIDGSRTATNLSDLSQYAEK